MLATSWRCHHGLIGRYVTKPRLIAARSQGRRDPHHDPNASANSRVTTVSGPWRRPRSKPPRILAGPRRPSADGGTSSGRPLTSIARPRPRSPVADARRAACARRGARARGNEDPGPPSGGGDVAAGRDPERRAGGGVNSDPMEPVAWHGAANDCEHPFGGPQSEATTQTLTGTAGCVPSEPA